MRSICFSVATTLVTPREPAVTVPRAPPMQHRLNFLPLPHGQGALRPTLAIRPPAPTRSARRQTAYARDHLVGTSRLRPAPPPAAGADGRDGRRAARPPKWSVPSETGLPCYPSSG